MMARGLQSYFIVSYSILYLFFLAKINHKVSPVIAECPGNMGRDILGPLNTNQRDSNGLCQGIHWILLRFDFDAFVGMWN